MVLLSACGFIMYSRMFEVWSQIHGYLDAVVASTMGSICRLIWSAGSV